MVPMMAMPERNAQLARDVFIAEPMPALCRWAPIP
jgi:hypothetical protein